MLLEYFPYEREFVIDMLLKNTKYKQRRSGEAIDEINQLIKAEDWFTETIFFDNCISFILYDATPEIFRGLSFFIICNYYAGHKISCSSLDGIFYIIRNNKDILSDFTYKDLGDFFNWVGKAISNENYPFMLDPDDNMKFFNYLTLAMKERCENPITTYSAGDIVTG